MAVTAIRKALAKNIRRYAREKGIAINSLADFAGVSRSQLYDLLSGKKSATVDWITKIAEALKVEPAELLKSDRK